MKLREKKSLLGDKLVKYIADHKENFKILEQTDEWLFVVVKNREGYIWVNDYQCNGGGAKWCLGQSTNITKGGRIFSANVYYMCHISLGEANILCIHLGLEHTPEAFKNDCKFLVTFDYENPNYAQIWDSSNKMLCDGNIKSKIIEMFGEDLTKYRDDCIDTTFKYNLANYHTISRKLYMSGDKSEMVEVLKKCIIAEPGRYMHVDDDLGVLDESEEDLIDYFAN